MVGTRLRAECQVDHPPASVGSLNKVSMPGALNGAVLGVFVNVCQNRVGGGLSYGPSIVRLRAIVTLCPYSVPPSEISR